MWIIIDIRKFVLEKRFEEHVVIEWDHKSC